MRAIVLVQTNNNNLHALKMRINHVYLFKNDRHSCNMNAIVHVEGFFLQKLSYDDKWYDEHLSWDSFQRVSSMSVHFLEKWVEVVPVVMWLVSESPVTLQSVRFGGTAAHTPHNFPAPQKKPKNCDDVCSHDENCTQTLYLHSELLKKFR